MAARKKKLKSLVIVESPAKAKTINKYLGTDFEVAASKGHVRDLPARRFGIDIEKGWVPSYQPLKDRKDVISALKKQAAKCDTVYLAPDPDREGEAIAWHLKEALNLADEKTRRVTFNEITKKAIEEAFANPGNIDMDRVQAQEARRFLDRVVGYKLSPLLRKKVARHLSAGRVQSVAVRLIVEREREIGVFKAEKYWKITALLAPEGTVDLDDFKKKLEARKEREAKKKEEEKTKKELEADEQAQEEAEIAERDDDAPAGPEPDQIEDDTPEGSFLAELTNWKEEKFHSSSQEQTDAIVRELENAKYAVARIEQKDRNERPQAPFTTSTLQQQASIRLRYSAKRTMMIAQRLYEGVNMGSEGLVALITYMRTDSTRISKDAQDACRKHVETAYGKPYVPDKPNTYASGKSAQEAHEAIRPTDLKYTPDLAGQHLPADQARLYTLIYNRFVASQMSPAVFAVTNVEVSAAAGTFKAQGKIQKFDGYRRVWAATGKQQDALLPDLKEQQVLDLLELVPTEHTTQPPPRFNEASLVKALEKEGIGRPSTYAAIISKIQERGYVEQKNRRFEAT
ncbi:MAG: type I DNA topoisomerase, partial [Gemmataceae bacterium]